MLTTSHSHRIDSCVIFDLKACNTNCSHKHIVKKRLHVKDQHNVVKPQAGSFNIIFINLLISLHKIVFAQNRSNGGCAVLILFIFFPPPAPNFSLTAFAHDCDAGKCFFERPTPPPPTRIIC